MSLKNLKANNKIALTIFIALILALLVNIYPKFDYTVNGTFIFPLCLSFLLLVILISISFSRDSSDFKISRKSTLVVLSLILFCITLSFSNFYYSLALVSLVNGLLFYKKNYLKIVFHSIILIFTAFLICKYFLGIELP